MITILIIFVIILIILEIDEHKNKKKYKKWHEEERKKKSESPKITMTADEVFESWQIYKEKYSDYLESFSSETNEST